MIKSKQNKNLSNWASQQFKSLANIKCSKFLWFVYTMTRYTTPSKDDDFIGKNQQLQEALYYRFHNLFLLLRTF